MSRLDYLDANGLRFAYLTEGQGPLVVLLHGFPDSAHTWSHAMPALARAGYRTIAPFMRGYAPTAIPADGKYDSDTLGADVLAILSALGVGRAIVVGHDWGASAAYSAAALAPERVRLLVVSGTPHPRSIRPVPTTVWRLRHFAPLSRPGAAKKIRAGNLMYIDALWRRWSPTWRDIPPSETAGAKAALREPGHLEAACAYYADISPMKLPASHKPNIAVPTVAFAGEQDVFPPRAYEKARTCFDASYEVVQVPGGHFAHREHPDTFTSELVRVVKEHDARSAK